MQQTDPWSTASPIRQDRWDEFQQKKQIVYDHLAYLRTALYLLNEIGTFPLDTLVPDNDRIFFTMTVRALYETAVLAVTKLTTDQAGEPLTVASFRNSVRDMLRPELVADFQEQLKKTKFDTTKDALKERAKALRNARLAHLSLDRVPFVVVHELEQLADEIEKLYQPLLFGASASYLPNAYDPEIRAANPPQATDIEKILNYFAKQSYALNLPETNAAAWPHHRSKMNNEEVQTFNTWRRRAGLPNI